MNNKIYLSGAITGKPYPEVQKQFAEAEQTVISWQKEPINPLNNGLPRTSSWAQHMIVDLQMLLQCSEILMLVGWEQSEGAKIEHTFAKKMNIPITYLTTRKSINYHSPIINQNEEEIPPF